MQHVHKYYKTESFVCIVNVIDMYISLYAMKISRPSILTIAPYVCIFALYHFRLIDFQFKKLILEGLIKRCGIFQRIKCCVLPKCVAWWQFTNISLQKTIAVLFTEYMIESCLHCNCIFLTSVQLFENVEIESHVYTRGV